MPARLGTPADHETQLCFTLAPDLMEPFAGPDAEFHAEVIGGLSHNASSALLSPARQVSIRFAPDGFRLEDPSCCISPFPVVLLPTAVAELEHPGKRGGEDLAVRRVSGAWPVQWITLRFATAARAKEFEEMVLHTTIGLVDHLFAEVFESPGGPRRARDCDDPELTSATSLDRPGRGMSGEAIGGSYVVSVVLQNHEYKVARGQRLAEPLVCVNWAELRYDASSKLNGIELFLFNHHGREATWSQLFPIGDELQDGLLMMVNNVLCYKAPEVRGGPISVNELPLNLWLAYRSVAEAEATVDLAGALLTQDRKGFESAGERLIASTERHGEIRPSGEPKCFLAAHQDLRPPEPRESLLRETETRRRQIAEKKKHEADAVSAAVAQDLARMNENPDAPFLGAGMSATCVFAP